MKGMNQTGDLHPHLPSSFCSYAHPTSEWGSVGLRAPPKVPGEQGVAAA